MTLKDPVNVHTQHAYPNRASSGQELTEEHASIDASANLSSPEQLLSLLPANIDRIPLSQRRDLLPLGLNRTHGNRRRELALASLSTFTAIPTLPTSGPRLLVQRVLRDMFALEDLLRHAVLPVKVSFVQLVLLLFNIVVFRCRVLEVAPFHHLFLGTLDGAAFGDEDRVRYVAGCVAVAPACTVAVRALAAEVVGFVLVVLGVVGGHLDESFGLGILRG
ncbi:unnamed protein product [Periconia digitata]|uniref:Uncharacterized protein n=1 Tax=Periconia digitata TaxID=1303443 RepID=A0A9W4U7K5_9PLEO|nr:unnamed protein product [Periconia digitata]